MHNSGQNSLLHVLNDAQNLGAGTGLYVQFFCIQHGLSKLYAFFLPRHPGTVITVKMGRESISEMVEQFHTLSRPSARGFTEHSICVQTKQSLYLHSEM